jgi:hypothetical protein
MGSILAAQRFRDCCRSFGLMMVKGKKY